MSTLPSASKPSLTGVRIKARKGAVKAQAKHEPTVFRDALYKHLEVVTPGDFEGYYNKLIQAGSSLEFLKYSDAFYEIYFVGGLLQPGGSYLQDGVPTALFSIVNAQYPAQVEELKKYVEVLNKLIRRYKYMQKPLEERSLPGLIQYFNRWSPELRDKFAVVVGLIMAQGLATTAPLLNLFKDHLVKDRLALDVLTLILRTYLVDQTMDQLSAALRKGGIRNLSLVFPEKERDPRQVEEHFKKVGLPQVSEWLVRRKIAAAKETVIRTIKELCENEPVNVDDIIEALKATRQEQSMAETEFINTIWQGFMATIDWTMRMDQAEAIVLREVEKYAPVMESFCTSAKTQVALINTVQLYCYDQTRVQKSFPQLLKILYNKDCISAQAIIYWHQKGAKPNGKQHFLSATEALVKFLVAQEEEEEEEEDGEEEE